MENMQAEPVEILFVEDILLSHELQVNGCVTRAVNFSRVWDLMRTVESVVVVSLPLAPLISAAVKNWFL